MIKIEKVIKSLSLKLINIFFIGSLLFGFTSAVSAEAQESLAPVFVNTVEGPTVQASIDGPTACQSENIILRFLLISAINNFIGGSDAAGPTASTAGCILVG